MDIRRILVVRDTVHAEGGLPALRPITRVAACAVIRNPLAGCSTDDLSDLVALGDELGVLLVREALAVASSGGLLWQSSDRWDGGRHRARGSDHSPAHGPSHARGDRWRQGAHSI